MVEVTRKTFYQNKLFVGLSKSNEKCVSQIVLKMVEELGEVTDFPNEKAHSFRCGMKVRSVKGWLSLS